ncbi:putative serine/threonine protein kinase [Chondromyces apiculatus DSM 436]|uniref:Putative serine/threonine protein kinase n=1 Tax=Chondromyces apiculatus DSM 436 TaxID=1192034 RepID=A0A017T188_9BACT|nr:putative serine/threonine protein kinase [Chondromyces apiculatus DSM 436]
MKAHALRPVLRATQAAFLAAMMLGAPRAMAQEDAVVQAKNLFNAGAKAYERAQYQAAIQAFEEAYRLSPRPGIRFSIAQAERRQYYVDKQPEHVRKALLLYQAYLAEVPQGGRRSDVVQALAELEPIAARLDAAEAGAVAPPAPEAPAPVKRKTQLMISALAEGAVLWMDGGEMKDLPFIEEVTPGKHRIKVSAPGYFDDEREVVTLEGAVVALDVAMKERPARLEVSTDARADLSIDGRTVGQAPLVQPVEVPSGKHLLTITRDGRKPFSREIELRRGQMLHLDIPLDRTPQRYVAYAFLGTGIAGMVAGGVFAGLALYKQGVAADIHDSAKDTKNLPSSERTRYNDALEQRDRWRQIGAITATSGVIMGGAGVLLYLMDNPSVPAPGRLEPEPKAPSPLPRYSDPSLEVSVVPSVGPGMGGALVVGRF